MHFLPVKPMSVNAAWRGGPRFRTNEYKQYESDLLTILPNLQSTVFGKVKIKLVIEAAVSNSRADLSNVMKPFEDILAKKYGFNDNQVYEIELRKKVVPVNKESISFSIKIL